MANGQCRVVMSSTHKCNNGPTPQQEQVKGAKKVFLKTCQQSYFGSIVEERQNNLFHLYLSVAEYLVFVFVWHIWRIVPPAGPECPSLRTIASPCYTPPPPIIMMLPFASQNIL